MNLLTGIKEMYQDIQIKFSADRDDHTQEDASGTQELGLFKYMVDTKQQREKEEASLLSAGYDPEHPESNESKKAIATIRRAAREKAKNSLIYK